MGFNIMSLHDDPKDQIGPGSFQQTYLNSPQAMFPVAGELHQKEHCKDSLQHRFPLTGTDGRVQNDMRNAKRKYRLSILHLRKLATQKWLDPKKTKLPRQ